MDFSSNNIALWSPMVQIGVIAGLVLLANVLCRKIAFFRNSMMPTAVLAGFLLLLLRSLNVVPIINTNFLETVTYHAIALGFIALSLRVPEKNEAGGTLLASKNGALIVSTYLVQGIVGMVVSLGVAYLINPDFFKASGILLAMAYGQGPGQANNVGSTYEALGMTGGRSFGLSLAAAGYLCACVVGVVFINVWNRKEKLRRSKGEETVSGSVTVDTFQHQNEIPIAESIDKLSIQAALIALVYLLTYLVTRGLCALVGAIAPGALKTVLPLLWGFNFIIGALVATITRVVMKRLRRVKLMNRQYQNNYLLSRLSGLAFDFMIVAGIASIEIKDLAGNWLPFLLMAILGGIATFFYLYKMSKLLYPNYVYEGFFSMFGMLTGTISSGVLLLREIDPKMETPAANNLITGSSFGIAFGFPVLLLVSYAAQSTFASWMTLALLGIYLVALLIFMLKVKGKRSPQDPEE